MLFRGPLGGNRATFGDPGVCWCRFEGSLRGIDFSFSDGKSMGCCCCSDAGVVDAGVGFELFIAFMACMKKINITSKNSTIKTLFSSQPGFFILQSMY